MGGDIQRKQETADAPIFAILPHHGITTKALNDFYGKLHTQSPFVNKIILISPDHYNAGGGFIQGVPVNGQLCFLSSCVRVKRINDFIPVKADFPLFHYQKDNILTTREHGLGTHFSYINTFFSGATVIPLVLHREKERFPQTEKALETFIKNNPLDSRTLVLASVDFSHHIDEVFARIHDAKSIESIQNGKDFSEIEVDCQNCLKFITNLAHFYQKPYFELIERTSVDTISKTPSGVGNTSHIFGIFRDKKPEEEKQIFGEYDANDSKIYGAFFGDTMFARELSKQDTTFKTSIFQEFFQENTLSKTGASFYHTKLYGFDFVGLNLETTIGTGQYCPSEKEKELSFVSSPESLSILKKIGITTVNIANNHSYDCGVDGYENTKKLITQSGMEYFGNESTYQKQNARSSPKGEQATLKSDISDKEPKNKLGMDIIKKEIRGIKMALIGVNDFDNSTSYTSVSENIKRLTQEGYRTIVSVHFGTEYNTGYTERQQTIAHALVDAGARVIIGHHPHVTEDVEMYKNTPIIYSLGNFIFDQDIPGTLSGQMLIFFCRENTNPNSARTISSRFESFQNPILTLTAIVMSRRHQQKKFPIIPLVGAVFIVALLLFIGKSFFPSEKNTPVSETEKITPPQRIETPEEITTPQTETKTTPSSENPKKDKVSTGSELVQKLVIQKVIKTSTGGITKELCDLKIDASICRFVSPTAHFRDISYIPPNLQTLGGAHIISSKPAKLRDVAILQLQALSDDFFEEFHTSLVVVSGYRDYTYQVGIKSRGCPDALCAKAGYSEHQTGLAVDLFSASTEKEFLSNPKFEAYFLWLQKNAAKYGFHNSYQKGPTVDGYEIEPWHWRYVGVSLATELSNSKQTLSEYAEAKK
ncbi:MAG: AmmeMemoRadiSam system protein B [Candidatus Gracilibacteria bacterium]|nr:AmmeMemoRadiSam system protein B [Candidatus Gracilibacteria bacterium]